MTRFAAFGSAALCACLAACVVTRSESTAAPEDHPPVIGTVEGVWRVLAEDGELLGYVRRYAEVPPDAGQPVEAGFGPWYAVQNRWAQELGLIDELGRAWRLRPHRDEPDWVGTGTVREGVAEVLGVPGEVNLEPASDPPAREP